MPAITLGYPQIEQQIRAIRRRRNWLTVQQAVYLCGGIVLLGIALLVVLAIRGERLTFTVAFWATIASAVLTTAAGVRLIWQRWIRAAETVRWIDRTAQLDDRLATLVAHHGGGTTQRLLPTLTSQLFALRYRWEATTLVPRRVPRSIYFFVATLVALIATSFIERPPATPQKFPHPMSAANHPKLGSDENGRLMRVQAQRSGNSETAEPGGGGTGDETTRGTRGSRTGDGKADGAGPTTGKNSTGGKPGGSGARSMRAEADAREQADPPPPALPDRVQDMIRKAMHQPPLDAQPRAAGAERTQTKAGMPRDPRGGASEQQQQARADGQPNRDALQPQPNPGATPAQQQPEGSESGRGTNGGGGGGQGTSGIYGAQAPPTQPQNPDKSFGLKLVLLGQSSHATMEAQKGKRGDVSDTGIPSEAVSGDTPLNPKQRPDEPLVRGEIPPEHEAMVKRIFTRAE